MRVLLIEDHKPLVRALRQGLEEEGFAVDVAPDGQEGDFKARTADYDVIILDLMLPKEDGQSLLQRWRKDGLTTHVLMLTARSSMEDKVKGLDLGADDYMTRPFELEKLLFGTGQWRRLVPDSWQIVPQAWAYFVHYATFHLPSEPDAYYHYNPLQQLGYLPQGGLRQCPCPLRQELGVELLPHRGRLNGPVLLPACVVFRREPIGQLSLDHRIFYSNVAPEGGSYVGSLLGSGSRPGWAWLGPGSCSGCLRGAGSCSVPD